MAGIEDVTAQVHRTLESTATGTRVVADAFRLPIAPEDDYVESRVALEAMDFASYAVGGLGAVAGPPAAGQVRATTHVDVPLADSNGATGSAGMTLVLYGPGDVRGLEAAQVVRRHPAPGALTAEETVLAHLEFDRPELPWAFSAAAPGAGLRPWLTLVVVESSVVSWEPTTGAGLRVMRVSPTQLPPLGQVHLWAHAQAATTSAAPVDLSIRLSPAYAPVNLSRLVSPRVLRQGTGYLAAVVPTTDVGVRAGLGLTGGTLADAWTSGSDDPVRLPVYDSWEFRTGPDGDFRSLALRLDAIAAPYPVGRRFVDASEPGRPLRPLDDAEPGHQQVVRCALYSPNPPEPGSPDLDAEAWPATMVDALHHQLDLPAQLEGAAEPSGPTADLPIVGPRIYAAAHRGSADVTVGDWYGELNLAPMHRIVAGLGTRVVQRDQEHLMQAAWAQLGEVEQANRAINLARFGEVLATRVHSRLADLEPGRLLQLTTPMAERIRVGADRTLAADVAVSATPVTAVSGAFRRATRPDGPALRRSGAVRARAGTLVGTADGLRDFTRTYADPQGVAALSAEVIAGLDQQAVAGALGVDQAAVAGLLQRSSAEVEVGVAGFLTRPERWAAPDAGYDPGGEVAGGWADQLLQSVDDPAVRRVREQRIGPLVAELSRSDAVAATPALSTALTREAVTLNNRLLDTVRLPPEPAGPQPGGPVGAGGPGHGGVGHGGVGHGHFGGLEHGVEEGIEVGGALGAGGLGPVARGLAGRRFTDVAGAGAEGVAAQPLRTGRVPVGDVALHLSLPDVSTLRVISPGLDVAERDASIKALADLPHVSVAPVLDRVSQLPVDTLRAGLDALVDQSAVLTLPATPRRPALAVDTASLAATLDPSRTVRSALAGRLTLAPGLRERWRGRDLLTPIMAAPHFDRPMFEALRDLGDDWLVPGLGLVARDDFVTVLETNATFMEAFFVGLSDEMGRELLWRGYPTDRRGTYFRRFWLHDRDELSTPIHAFSADPLGRHVAAGGSAAASPRAVIVVKSELVRRFPDLIIEAVRDQGSDHDPYPTFETDASPQVTAAQLFAVHPADDVALVGLDLSVDDLRDPAQRWWIAIAEHPGATRFERPEDDQLAPDLRFLPAGTATDAAAFALDHLHDPTRVAFPATDLITKG